MGGRPHTLSAARPLRILVTGAAGLIGRAVSSALAERGHAVVGLLRRRAAASPDPAPSLAAGSISPIQGDVAEPHLGLDAAAAQHLASRLDLIVHCAAVTGFSRPAEVYDRVNRGGTAQVLAFAARPCNPIPLLHVSTAYVCGDTAGSVAEAPATAARFNNGYEASKAAAEALVAAAQQAGHVVAVARPSIVVGRSTDGHTASFGTVYQLVRLVAEGRIRVLPASPGASLDLVPLDHVVGGLVDIAERMTEADGGIFHLASGFPVPITALSYLRRAFPQLHAPRFVAPERFPPDGLTPREQWLHAQVVEAYAAYLRPSPRFALANLAALSGRVCPPVDEGCLQRLVGYAVSAGFFPGERLSARPDTAGPGYAAARSPS